MSAPSVNHNATVSIEQMIYNRLPFLANGGTNTTLLSQYTLEFMSVLDTCFQIASQGGTLNPPNQSLVGQEQYYSVVQQSIIADIIATYILMLQAAKNSAGVNGGTAPTGTFITVAKAGSAEVEYAQFDIKKSTLLTADLQQQINFYKEEAKKKALSIGCLIDISDDARIVVELMARGQVQPFIILGACGYNKI